MFLFEELETGSSFAQIDASMKTDSVSQNQDDNTIKVFKLLPIQIGGLELTLRLKIDSNTI